MMNTNNKYSECDITQIIKDYDILKSSAKVAEKYQIPKSSLWKILKRAGANTMINGNAQNNDKIPQAIAEYNAGISINGILHKYGLTHGYFKKILKNNNIEIINRTYIPSGGDKEYIVTHLDQILADYREIKNVSKVAKIHNITKAFLGKYLLNNNYSKLKHTKVTDQNLKDQIYELYVNQNKNTADISNELNITVYHINRILLKYYGKSIIRPKGEIIRTMNLTTEHQIKAHNGLHKRKEFTLPSGKIIKLQGYEDDFLYYVFKYSNLTEDEFQWSPRFRIKISNKNKGKHIHYYPDFYLPKYNLVIEIKSEYIYQLQLGLNKRKIRKTKEAGYKFLMIKDKKYSKFHKFLRENNLLKPIEG